MGTFDVKVSDDFMLDGLAVWVTMRQDGSSRLVMRLAPDGTVLWEAVDPAARTAPTIALPGDAARALLDSLLRHYQGASDMHTVRSDLLHERGRVDKLMDALMELASRPQLAARED